MKMEMGNKDSSVLLLDLIDLGRKSFKKEEDEKCQKLLDMMESLYLVMRSKTANVDCNYEPIINNQEIVAENSSYSKIVKSLIYYSYIYIAAKK
jgi:hypothetical protein